MTATTRLGHALAMAGPLALAAVLALPGCNSPDARGNSLVKPIYNKDTGKLEQIAADRDGNGTVDTRAYMDGAHLKYIEIDRNEDGIPDRWEYYAPGTPDKPSAGTVFDTRTQLVRAEESNSPDGKVTRWEFYENGVIQRVNEDTNLDGRIDKWEQYDHGALVRIDLDLTGRGKAERRLVYRADGELDHIEVDKEGVGNWQRLIDAERSGSRREGHSGGDE
jgi:hypothetical protein